MKILPLTLALSAALCQVAPVEAKGGPRGRRPAVKTAEGRRPHGTRPYDKKGWTWREWMCVGFIKKRVRSQGFPSKRFTVNVVPADADHGNRARQGSGYRPVPVDVKITPRAGGTLNRLWYRLKPGTNVRRYVDCRDGAAPMIIHKESLKPLARMARGMRLAEKASDLLFSEANKGLASLGAGGAAALVEPYSAGALVGYGLKKVKDGLSNSNRARAAAILATGRWANDQTAKGVPPSPGELWETYKSHLNGANRDPNAPPGYVNPGRIEAFYGALVSHLKSPPVALSANGR